ncbi:MAG: TIR domain-containing protein [Bacteroidetes bacterium]|nr:TIR domain-containing protein [Bacteroidota bacterium]
MDEKFKFDVFISHSSKDMATILPLAIKLKGDGIRVWLDEWEIKPGDSIPVKIEEGLENSRVLVLCMSTNVFGSDWAQLESWSFRFRDPLNKERRFIPLRIDNAPLMGSLGHLLYINWLPDHYEEEYPKLFEACHKPAQPFMESQKKGKNNIENAVQLDYKLFEGDRVTQYAFNSEGTRTLTCSNDETVRLWDLKNGKCLGVFKGHKDIVTDVSWGVDPRHALSCSKDHTVRLWDVETRRCLSVLEGHTDSVDNLSWSSNQLYAISGAQDKTVRLWNLQTKRCMHVFIGHAGNICSVSISVNGRFVVSGGGGTDKSVRFWEIDPGLCLRVFEGHKSAVRGVAMSSDNHQILSCSNDSTLRLWDIETGRCLRVLEGHTGQVTCMKWNPDHHLLISGSDDKTVRLWDVKTGRCLRIFKGHKNSICTVAWSADGRSVFSGDDVGLIKKWNLDDFFLNEKTLKINPLALEILPEQVQYTNAKVLLVGESGTGKTGLSMRLASDFWEPSDSTVGAWATQWNLKVNSGDGVEQEIWLWDFGGQADQRLIHQLYMDETALAVLVFDGQKEDLFETLGQWDRDLTRASREEFTKLLVAGRVDAGGLRVSRSEVEKFAEEHKFLDFMETSAKQGFGCQELKQAILHAIKWDEIPCRTTEVLFKRLKEEIIRLKDDGRVLMRFNELRETLQLRLSGKLECFSDEDLHAVLTLLAGPCVVWELTFGSWVLLQPERINAYAQAVIRTLQADELQRGCLMEERVLKGELLYESSMPRLGKDEERFVLLAMHQTLVERGLCMRQSTFKGNLLIFPSYFHRERPEPVKFPSVLVSFSFTGFLDEIYATLVVRMHHTEHFKQDCLWHNAADFKTNSGKELGGVKLTRHAQGLGELEVYFDSAVTMEEKIVFSKYVHEHLLQYAQDVERLRYYICPHCGIPVGNREVAMDRLNEWLIDQPLQPNMMSRLKVFKLKGKMPNIICVGCEKRVPLWDEMEQSFASPEIQQRVLNMQEESAIELSNQSKERALVGEVISTVALADQISREFHVSKQGIDMEIEFTDDAHEPTGKKLYLQLKYNDSYLRMHDDIMDVFTIKDERLIDIWINKRFPVMLVIRNSDGEVRWMDVQDWLQKTTNFDETEVIQIPFQGERFDVMAIRRWRSRILQSV